MPPETPMSRKSKPCAARRSARFIDERKFVFFQAEDGIRDYKVTGVQTCALPISYSPKRLQLCAIGLVVGLLLGGATTAGAELLDDRIHDEKTLKKLIQIPVLSEIPNVSTDTETRAERRDGWLVWATTSLVLVSILAGSALSYFRG